jgi:hypothetical protein
MGQNTTPRYFKITLTIVIKNKYKFITYLLLPLEIHSTGNNNGRNDTIK